MFKKRSQRRLSSGHKQSKFRNGAARRLAKPLIWEGSLEDRRLLAATMTLTAANEILYQGSAINNDLFVDTSGGDYFFNDTAEIINVVIQPGSALSAVGSGTNTVQVINIPLTSLVEIRTGDGDDSVKVLSSPQSSQMFIDTELGLLDTTEIGSLAQGVSNILGTIDVIDSGGIGLMTVEDSVDVAGRTWTFHQNPSGAGSITWGTTAFVTYGPGIEEVTANMGLGVDSVLVEDLGAFVTTVNINSGDGVDDITVWATPSGTTLNIDTSFGIPDTITIGELFFGLDSILGDIHVVDAGAAELVITDGFNATGRSWTLDQNIGGEGTVNWGGPNSIIYGVGVSDVTIDAGDGADIFDIQSTGSFASVVTVNGGNGLNIFDVFDNGSVLNINGGIDTDIANVLGNTFQVNIDLDGGQDSVVVFDNQAPVYIVTGDDDDTVDILDTSDYVNVSTGAGMDLVRVWDTGADLDISTGDDDDTVTIYGTGVGTTTTIDTGNGAGNVVNIGGDAPFGTGVNSLDNVLGSVYVYGSGDPNRDTTLNVDDSGSITPDNISFWVDFLAKRGFIWGAQPSGEIGYDNAVNALNFWGGSGGNDITIYDTLIGSIDGTVTNIRTGQGNDTVVVYDNNGPNSPGPDPYTTLIIDLQNGSDRLEVESLARPGLFSGGPGDDYINASTVVLVPLTISGGTGDDSLAGGSGDDLIQGNEGDDSISGGAGVNTLVGGLGDDNVQGGPDWDIFEWRAGDGFDVYNGGGGSADEVNVFGLDQSPNHFDVQRWGTGYQMVYNADPAQGFLAQSVSSSYFFAGFGAEASAKVEDMSGIDVERLVFDFVGALTSSVEVDGTIGADDIHIGVLPYDPQALTATGLGYQLRVYGTPDVAGNELIVRGMAGDDHLKAEQGSEALAEITLDGGEGDDTLEADAVLIGGPGNDTFIVPFGINFVDGVIGNDRILILGSAWDDSISVTTSNLGFGATQVSILQGLNSSTNTVLNVDVIEIEAYAGNDRVNLSGNGTIPFHVYAGADNDSVDASNLTGASVTAYGGAGDDSLVGGSAPDYLDGGDGYDRLNGGQGNDSIEGGSGSDEIFYIYNSGADLIDGGEGVNILEIVGNPTATNVIHAYASNIEPTTMLVDVNGTTIATAAIQGLEIYGGSVADSFRISDMTGTPLVNTTIDLIAGAFADLITLDGSDNDDEISVAGLTSNPNDPVVVSGLATLVKIHGATPIPGGFNDILTIRSGRGSDSLSVYRNLTQGIGVVLDGQGDDDHFDVAVQGEPGINKVTVIAGSGEDLIHIHEGNVVVNGNGGDVIETLGTAAGDTISLVGAGNILTQTVNGVVANIDIAGFTGVVHVDALGGNDDVALSTYSLPTTVMGGDGNDLLDANGMPIGVTLYGGSGNDVLVGGMANDYISGGSGRDLIDGNEGDDELFGDADADIFVWNAGDDNDIVDGGTGYDAFVISGTDGTDCFHVAPDNVFVNQARINVDVPGGPADDGSLLAADVEHISMIGGNGADYFEIASMVPTPVTAIDADLGSTDGSPDVVVVKTSNAGSDVTVTPSATNADVDVNGLSALIRLYNTTTADTLGVMGGFGDDNIYVAPETLGLISVLINGGGGDDVLEGAQTIVGGSGDDLIKGTNLNDVLLGGLGNDTIYGYAGDDLILADATASGAGGGITCDSGMMGVGAFAIDPYVNAGGDDLVFAGAGNDTVNGGFADDNLYGEEGDDLIGFLVQASNALLLSDFEEPGDDFITGGLGNDTIYAGAGNDFVEGNDGNDYAEGNDGDDTVYGGNGDDDVNGNAGNDFVDAGAGDDTATGGTGNDTVIGGLGNDIVVGNDGDDLMWLGSDELGTDSGTNNLGIGGYGNDTIYGSSLVDTILGDTQFGIDPVNDGNDSIYGFAGNDTIYGMGGNDWIDSGADDDFVQGDLGDDWINGGLGNDSLDGEEGNDTVYGGGGNDSIDGDAGDDLLYGDEGNDIIAGEEGNDTAFGGDGQDAIFGGTGDDFLNGGEGDDQLWGQEGNDTLGVFVYFGAIMYDNGADKMVGGVGNDMIAGALVDTSGNIVPDGNDAMFGQEGDDTIYGGAGGDMIYGGDGDDVLLGGTPLTANTIHAPRDPHLPGDGNDTIYGGMGFDIVDGGNDNNLLDAGDDGIRETVLGGTGNDMAYSHQITDPVNYDRMALDGGYNHVFCDGGLLEPPVPAVPNPPAYIDWVIPVEYYTGYKVLHNGDVVEHPPLKYRLNPNNGPNGPVRKPIKVKPMPVKKVAPVRKAAPVKKAAPVRKPVTRPTFAGKANTVGKLAAAAALRKRNQG